MANIKLYSELPKLRLVLHCDYIPSVNDLYSYCKTTTGVRVYKSPESQAFQDVISRQIVNSVNLKNYPWINNDNLYVTDYKFVLRNNFEIRDTTNMIKATEDAIHRTLGSDDSRVVRCSCQKFKNESLIQELVIFTLVPYIGSLSVFDLPNQVETNKITELEEKLKEKYMNAIQIICNHLGESPILSPSNPPLDLGYLPMTEFTSLVSVDYPNLFLRTLKLFNIKLRLVSPKRSQWIRMASPDGIVCEMYDEEVRTRLKEGYTFTESNYIMESD